MRPTDRDGNKDDPDGKRRLLRWGGTYLAKLAAVSRNPARFQFCTPGHTGYRVHQRYQGAPGFEALGDFMKVKRRLIDPSVSDSRVDHLKAREDSIGKFANDRGLAFGPT